RPGQTPPEPPPHPGTLPMLDALLEVLELTWRDAGVRHAALADIVVAPRLGPAGWRSFERADLFITAGRATAEPQLEALGSGARPLPSGHAAGAFRITLSNVAK